MKKVVFVVVFHSDSVLAGSYIFWRNPLPGAKGRYQQLFLKLFWRLKGNFNFLIGWSLARKFRFGEKDRFSFLGIINTDYWFFLAGLGFFW